MELVRDGHQEMVGEMMSDVVAITARGKQIKCKSYGQKEYIRAIKENTVVEMCIRDRYINAYILIWII